MAGMASHTSKLSCGWLITGGVRKRRKSAAKRTERRMPEIELTGLDGGSLLGFLAALGALRILSVSDGAADVRMRWTRKRTWIPVVHHARIDTIEQLTSNLASRVCGEQSINPAWEIGKDLTLSRSEFRSH